MATLITGGTGFIGAEIARLLLSRGESEITLFDISDSTQRLDDIADQVTVVSGDVGDAGRVLEVVQASRAMVVYHMGGLLSVPSDADPQAAFRANAMGTFHVLEACRTCGVERLMLADAPAERIVTVNYLIAGVEPTPSADELAAIVREKIPAANIDFHVDEEIQALLDKMLKPIVDTNARSEWDWAPSFSLGENGG